LQLNHGDSHLIASLCDLNLLFSVSSEIELIFGNCIISHLSSSR
jgi:hypothetical protein